MLSVNIKNWKRNENWRGAKPLKRLKPIQKRESEQSYCLWVGGSERGREKERSKERKAEREGAIGRKARLVSLDGLSEQPCGLTSAQRGGEHLLMAWGWERVRDRQSGRERDRERERVCNTEKESTAGRGGMPMLNILIAPRWRLTIQSLIYAIKMPTAIQGLHTHRRKHTLIHIHAQRAMQTS